MRHENEHGVKSLENEAHKKFSLDHDKRLTAKSVRKALKSEEDEDERSKNLIITALKSEDKSEGGGMKNLL